MIISCVLFFLWYHQESNRGHKDFQSFALPTELWYLVCFASANVRHFFELPNTSAKNPEKFSVDNITNPLLTLGEPTIYRNMYLNVS